MAPIYPQLEGQILALARQRLKADGDGLSLSLMTPQGDEVLAIRADQVRLAKLALLDDGEDGR